MIMYININNLLFIMKIYKMSFQGFYTKALPAIIL